MVLWVQRYNFFVIILQICRNLLNFAANKQEPYQENGQYIYVNRMFDGGDNFTTEFVIYPIQQENNFWRIEIEIYC